MGFYGGGWVKKMIGIQEPLKFVLRKIGLGKLSEDDAKVLITLLKEIQELPKLERGKVSDPNTAILLDIWEDAKKHLSFGFLASYENVLDPVINFCASKIDYDQFYKGLAYWFLGEMLRRGFQFPGHNRPSSQLWHTIKPETRESLSASIKNSYNILQDRLKVIEEKLGDSPEARQHKASRFEQFINRILTDFERAVKAWE